MKYEKLALEQYRELKKKCLTQFQEWDKTKGIGVIYTGEEISAMVQVTKPLLTLTVGRGIIVLEIDLEDPPTDTLQGVINAINTFGSGFAAALGDQFDGNEVSADLTVVAATACKNVTVWLAMDYNYKIRVTLPAVPAGKECKVTRVLGASTYGSGTSKIQVYVAGVKVWEENAGATTEEKEGSFDRISTELAEVAVVKIFNSEAMTAGYLTVSWEQKDAQPYTVY